MDLRDRKVIITGAGSGIGLSTAREFAERKAVPILLDINQEALDRAIAGLKSEGHNAYAFRVDVSDFECVRALATRLDEDGLSPDVVVNSAGLTLVCHVKMTSSADWRRIMEVNVMGTIHMIDSFLPQMLERGRGHIVNIGSIEGIIPVPGQAAYCASKFVISGLTEVLYYDLKGLGIGVTLLCPGYVDTPMARAIPIRDIPVNFKGSQTVMKILRSFALSPERISHQITRAVEKDRFLVIPGLPSRLMYHYRRLLPRLATMSGTWTARFFDLLRKGNKGTPLFGLTPRGDGILQHAG